MASSGQGVRSSRTDPILKRHRLQMRKLDRKISKLDYAIPINELLNRPLSNKQRRQRDELDHKRMKLRQWMKLVKQ